MPEKLPAEQTLQQKGSPFPPPARHFSSKIVFLVSVQRDQNR
jgi:hypothetical protein